MFRYIEGRNQQCTAFHLPSRRTATLRALQDAGMTTELCTPDSRLCHVTLPAGWELRDGDNEVLIVDGDGTVQARMVSTNDFDLQSAS
jgi:hypothetical protein